MSLKQNDEYYEQQMELAEESKQTKRRFAWVKCPRCKGKGWNWLEGYGKAGCSKCEEGGVIWKWIKDKNELGGDE